MAETHPELEEARATRLETLSIVADLDQEQSERRPEPEKWSAGEVLDHLLKLDVFVVRELEMTLAQRRRGLPLTYRSIADVDTTIPWILRPVLPFVEIPFAFANAVFPQSLRRSILGSRRIPLRAPGVLRPRFGRPIAGLREELGKTFDVLEEQQAENPNVDLAAVYYYNPITGLNSVAGMYLFLANHEKRHQGQLRDLVST